MFAVVKAGGKQYRVAQGDVVQVEKVTGEVGDRITLSEVLLVGGDGEARIGTPVVTDARVTAEIVNHNPGRKVIVFKKKRRKSYSRKRGHRQKLTTLKILAIEA